MPDVFGNRLFLFLGGLVILLILLLISILYARKRYWNTAGLSNRKRRTLERARLRVILLIVSFAACAMTALLALTVNIPAAIGFAIVAFLVILLVFSAYGRGGGGDGTPGDLPSAYFGGSRGGS